MLLSQVEHLRHVPAPVLNKPAGTNNHTVMLPSAPQREALPPRRDILEASYPQNHLHSSRSQSMTPEVTQETPQRPAVESPVIAETSSGPGTDPRDTSGPQPPQNSAQPPQKHAGDIKKVELPLRRVLNKGDYISRIALEVYGSASEEILALIQKHNPQIKDIDRVEVGEKVLFPAIQVATP
jgi:hypothetical protein